MIDKLEMFIALAREGHFGRAAESLNIAQPTLSGGIRQLEDQLGVQLVHRGSRFGGLTPEGQTALGWARRITSDARQLRDEMRMSRHGLSGEVRLAVIPTAQTWAARLCTSFSDRHPNVRFTILSHTSREILQMIEDFTADAGISYLDNEPLGRVDTARLYTESYILVCPCGSGFDERAQMGWAELDRLPLALLTPTPTRPSSSSISTMTVGTRATPHELRDPAYFGNRDIGLVIGGWVRWWSQPPSASGSPMIQCESGVS